MRLGDSATVTLQDHQRGGTHHAGRGPRRLGALGRRGRAVRTRPDPRSRARAPRSTPCSRPTRRGDRPAARVTVRSYGLLGLAFRQTTRRRADAITPPWTLRALPEFRSRRLLPEKLSRLRVIDGQVVTRGRGQGSEFDSLREYVMGDDPRAHRLAGQCPTRAPCGQAVAARSATAGCSVCHRHRPHQRRPHRTGLARRPGHGGCPLVPGEVVPSPREPRRRPGASTRPCCWRASPRTPVTGWTCSPSTPDPRERLRDSSKRTCPA